MNVLDLKVDRDIFSLISSMIYSENKWKCEGYPAISAAWDICRFFSPPIFPSILLEPDLKNPCTEESCTIGGA